MPDKKRTPSEKKGKGGYGDPPRAHQFKPGFSGNPKGRPKAAKESVIGTFERILSEKVRITKGGKEQYIEMQELLIRHIVKHALDGKSGPVKAVFGYLDIKKDLEKEYAKERTGVLVVPAQIPEELWAMWAERQQKPYREAVRSSVELIKSPLGRAEGKRDDDDGD